MECIIKIGNQSVSETDFLNHLNKIISVNKLFEENSDFSSQIYEALGFKEKRNSGIEELLVVDENEISKKEGESFAEMQRRVIQNINIRKRIEIANKNNIVQGKSYSYYEIKEIFNNDKLFDNEIYKQLSTILQSSNLVFKFGSLNQGKKTINAYYDSINNSINIDTLVLQTPNLATSDFKRILLHEIIHAATHINLKEDATLTNTQKTALNNLNNLIIELNRDKDFFAQYGLTNANELLAELANERFVDKLKKKTFKDNQSFFDKIISEIVKLLGLNTTAYDIVKESFDNLVKEYKGINQITPQQKQQALQLYSQYLDTIFPDSKVKDIVYHGTDKKFDVFDFTVNRKFGNLSEKDSGMFFSFDIDEAAGYGDGTYKSVIKVLVNSKNPVEIKDLIGNRAAKYKSTNDAVIGLEPDTSGKNIVVFKPEQIHILGSKQDIEGFRRYVEQPINKEGRTVAIIGTAGRSQVPTLQEWNNMLKDAESRVNPNDTLISGGAAFADHIAVKLFLEGKVKGLKLRLPAKIANNKFVGGYGTAGGTANYYHDKFSKLLGVNTVAEIQQAINKGAEVTYETETSNKAMFIRNEKVAKESNAMIAYTYGEGNEPADGGTKDTWNKSKYSDKTHVSISKIKFVEQPINKEVKTLKDVEDKAIAIIKSTKGDDKYIFLNSQKGLFGDDLVSDNKQGQRLKGKNYKGIDIVSDYFTSKTIKDKSGKDTVDILFVDSKEDAQKQFDNYIKGGAKQFSSIEFQEQPIVKENKTNLPGLNNLPKPQCD